MDNHKWAIIYGDEDEETKDLAGTVEMFGDMKSPQLHIVDLREFVHKKFPYSKKNEDLNDKNNPVYGGYIFTSLGDAVFLNLTIDANKKGIIFLPNTISPKLKESLYEFVEKLNDYEVYIYYNLKLENEEPDGELLQGLNEDDKPIDILNSYFELEEGKNKAR